MKKLLCVITLTEILLLSACSSSGDGSNETGQRVNLLNIEKFVDDGWINFDGEVSSSENEMVHTESISYNSNNKYYLNDSAYVSYFNDDKFIETALHNEENPIELKIVKEANNIKLSFSNKKSERIVLEEK